MLRLFRYLKPYWLLAVVLMAASGLMVWTTLELPALMAKIVNDGIVTGDQTYIWQTGLTMLLYATISSISAIVASFCSPRIGSFIARDLRNDIYKKVLSFSIAELDDFSTASLITRTTNDVNQNYTTIVMCLTMLIRAPLMCIGAIVQAVNTAPDMTWIIALAVVAILVCVIIILRLALPKFKLYQELIDKITLKTRENLTGLRVIRAFNNQTLEQQKFERENTRLKNTYFFIGQVMSFQDPLIMLIMNGTAILCIYVGIHYLRADISYLGDMMAFMQYALQVIMAFLFMTVLFVMIPRAGVSAARINAVLGRKNHIKWLPKTKSRPSKTPEVEFKNVSFTYKNAKEPVLRDISFKATAGETVAFIGSTGSGKSTLINLVPRFHDATSGEILINKVDIKNYAKYDLMSKIGYVPQKGFLFSGSIKSNLRFGADNATDEELRTAAKIAEADNFIQKLPEKYQSHVAEGGSNLSGGQRQRLCITRAIVKDPDIYIFDDAFSALDLKTDRSLRQNLRPVTKDSVTLIVAQRINTIKDADQIIVLSKGQKVGHGTHRELLNTCPIYQEIAKSQFSDAEYAAELKGEHGRSA